MTKSQSKVPQRKDDFQIPLSSILIIVVVVAIMLAIANTVSPFVAWKVMNICLFALALGVMMLLLFRGTSQRDDTSPHCVASLPDEMTASAIVALLETHGINATTTGSFTSGFQTEVASDVKVVVAFRDADEATAIIESSKKA